MSRASAELRDILANKLGKDSFLEATSLFVKYVVDEWRPADADGLDARSSLAYRSRLLGRDRSVVNVGGGNTSTKAADRGGDPTGPGIAVLWVKGSGTDLASIDTDGFTGLRLDDILPLIDRDSMSDEAMVQFLSGCQLEPSMPRASIETLLHAFVPSRCVDHTHPDAINMICCSANGERLAQECFGDDALWIPYTRPGFTLSKQVGTAVRNNPRGKLVLLAKHGLVTWGETDAACYRNTLAAINRAVSFIANRTEHAEPFGGQRWVPPSRARRDQLLSSIVPTIRNDVAQREPSTLLVDTSDQVTDFVCGRRSEQLSQVGAACPDHLIQTKRRPLWIEFDPERDGADALIEKTLAGLEQYRQDYAAYFSRHRIGSESMSDPNPRVVVFAGLGLVTIGKDEKAATLARDFYHRAVAVMRGASALDDFVSLTEEESYAVEYWPLELYKLSLATQSNALSQVEGR